jgi:hypothetical protein
MGSSALWGADHFAQERNRLQKLGHIEPGIKTN